MLNHLGRIGSSSDEGKIMATAEEAIATALGIPAGGILAWTNHLSNDQLELVYDGDPGISSENITVLIVNAHAGE